MNVCPKNLLTPVKIDPCIFGTPFLVSESDWEQNLCGEQIKQRIDAKPRADQATNTWERGFDGEKTMFSYREKEFSGVLRLYYAILWRRTG